jgi:hypothetical protein
MSGTISPIIRYWVQLNKRSTPIETDNLRNVKNDIHRSSSAVVIIESIYPNSHEFKITDTSVKEKINGELSDAQRSDTVSRMFNKHNQYDSQVMRKKPSAAKPKSKRK